MPRRPASSATPRTSSPATTQKQKQRPANASVYRVRIEPPGNTQPFGSVINDASLLQALNEFGPVFHLEVKSSICHATFKSTATVDKLIAAKTLTISGIACSTNYLLYSTEKALDDRDEQRLHELFSKQSIKPANLLVTESREVHKVVPPGTDIEWRIVITNRSTQDKVLCSIEMPQQRQRNFMLRSPVPSPKNPIKVGPGGTHTQGIKFVTKRHELGVFRHTLLLNFSNFIYEHVLVVNVSTPKATEDLELLKPQSEFVRPTLPDSAAPELRVVPAFTVGRDGKVNARVQGAELYLSNSKYSGARELKPYPVPPNIHAVIEGRKSTSFNPWKVQTNWRTRLHELLFLEEAQQAKLTRAYDLRAVPMEQVTSYVEGEKSIFLSAPMTRVHCANLAEKRPSVQKADKVFAWVAGGGAQQQYEGYVHRVEGEALVLIFCEDFHAQHPPGTRMNMRFDVDRLATRLMHRAVDDALLDVVWPAQLAPATASQESQLDEVLHDASLPAELNEQQRRVIAQLATRMHGSAPFLLVGPFGTGKTRTLIEFLRRLVAQRKPGATDHVLVCSPSNSSVDKYVTALQDLLGPEQMLRIQAPHRNTVANAASRYSHQDKTTGFYALPEASALLRMVVVVSTTRSAAQLVNAGVPKGHFTHIIVDEAAQLMEAEALLPISLAGPSTAVIMAGDPQQLGPVTFSKVDSVHGLHCSIMERLLLMPAYQQIPSAKRACCKLTKNYRSHPQLVKMLSRLSYSGSLEAHAPTAKVNALKDWGKAGTDRGFPMLFVSLEGGSEEREGDSPSWFNRQEAHVLHELVVDLMRACEAKGLAQEEVGIITPYFKQSQKLRMLLRTKGLSRVRVGSTEEFHGHEVKALFISTVRTSVANLELDEHFDSGFVGNPKRFNTALSRAVALVVVVGDLAVLTRSAEWKEMLRVCQEHKCFVTRQAPPLPGVPAPLPAPQGEGEGQGAGHGEGQSQPAAGALPSLPTSAHDVRHLEAGFSPKPSPAGLDGAAADALAPAPAAAAPSPVGRSGKRGGGRGRGGGAAAAPAAALPPPPPPPAAAAPPSQMHALLGSMGAAAATQPMPAMPAGVMTEESILRRGRGRAGRAPQLGFADEGDDKADEAVDDEDEDEDEATPAWVEEPSANGAAEGEDLLPSTLVQPPGAIEAGRQDFLSGRGHDLPVGSQPVGRSTKTAVGAPRTPVGPPSTGPGGRAVMPSHAPPPGQAVPMPSMGSGVANPSSMYSPVAQPAAPPYANGCCSGFGLGAAAAAPAGNGFHGNGTASVYSAPMYGQVHGQVLAQTTQPSEAAAPQPAPPQPPQPQPQRQPQPPQPPQSSQPPPPQPPQPPAAQSAEHEVQLYAHGGVGLLFVRGAQTPPYAVHEEADGIRIVISLFNLEYELVPKMKAFDVVLRPSDHVLSTAAASHSCVHGLTPAETRLVVRVPDTFDANTVAIDFDEEKESLNLRLKKLENAPIQLVMNTRRKR